MPGSPGPAGPYFLVLSGVAGTLQPVAWRTSRIGLPDRGATPISGLSVRVFGATGGVGGTAPTRSGASAPAPSAAAVPSAPAASTGRSSRSRDTAASGAPVTIPGRAARPPGAPGAAP